MLEKRLSSQRIFSGRIVSLRVDEVETETGRKTTREVIDRPNTVSILALDDQGRIILVRQYRYAVDMETLEIPAGTVNPGETPDEAAHRELREETGCDCRTLEKLAEYYPAVGYSTERMAVYLAKGLTKSPLAGDEDKIEVERRPFDETLQEILAGKSPFVDAKSSMAILLLACRGLTGYRSR